MRELVCALCALRQPVAAACSGCGVAFGAYACLTCRFFDDDLQKRQFHCAACGICRVGGAESFFHCATCGCCYARSLQVGCLLVALVDTHDYRRCALACVQELPLFQIMEACASVGHRALHSGPCCAVVCSILQ